MVIFQSNKTVLVCFRYCHNVSSCIMYLNVKHDLTFSSIFSAQQNVVLWQFAGSINCLYAFKTYSRAFLTLEWVTSAVSYSCIDL